MLATHFDCGRSSDVAGGTPPLVGQPAVRLFPDRRSGFSPGYSDRTGTVGALLVELNPIPDYNGGR